MEEVSVQDVNRVLLNRFFRDENDELYLPLRPEEREMAALVHPQISNVLMEDLRRRGVSKNFRLTQDYDSQVAQCYDNLGIIIENIDGPNGVRGGDGPARYWNDNYRSYREMREGSAQKLVDIASAINLDRRNSNISQIVGAGAGMVGCVGLAACVFFPPAALVLAIGGGVAAGLGGLVSAGTSITEASLLARNIAEAKSILENDETQFQPYRDSLQHSVEFVAAIEAVLSIDLARSLSQRMRGLVRQARDFEAIVRRNIREFMDELTKGKEYVAKVVPIISITVTALISLFIFRGRSHIIFDSVVFIHHVFYGFTTGLELSVQVGRIIGQVFTRGGIQGVGRLSAQGARALFHGVFVGVGMALDAINIIYASVDLSTGSQSEHAASIMRAVDAMRKELQFMDEIYEGLRVICDGNNAIRGP